MLETLLAGPLRGNAKDPGAPTTYVGDIDGGPPGRSGLRPWSEGVL
jgi:hypothetical protein